MGNRCCTDRKLETYKATAIPKGAQEIPGCSSSSPSLKKAKSIGYHSNGGDAAKFDKAFEANDLKAFVELLPSQQEIRFDEKVHPWAEDPKSVGVLAGTQLAIIASAANNETAHIKDDIRKAGAIPAFVDFLRSDQVDRVQAGVVALSFMTTDNEENAIEAHRAGVMPLMIQHLHSKIGGMRAASAMTLRNLCMSREEYKQVFIDLGGVQGLVFQLDAPAGPEANQADLEVEAIMNLQDIIEDSERQVIQSYGKVAIKAGATEKLTRLLQSDDADVRSSAEEVLGCLANVRT